MKEELQRKLYEKYPILSNLAFDKEMNNTPLAWDGITCNDGWYNIINTLCNEITKHLQLLNISNVTNDKFTCNVQQIKEKFGGLRFYIDSADDYIYELIDKAESTSEVVCELCGSIKNIGKTKGWITTMCKSCYNVTKDTRKWHPIGDK